MDFEITPNDLFQYIGKLYVEAEQAKQALSLSLNEIAQLREQLNTGENNDPHVHTD